MSLRNQITVHFIVISILILLLGGSLAIWQARGAVRQEVDASLNLALQLIRLNMPTVALSGIDESSWLQRFSSMQQTRHLTIRLRKPGGEVLDFKNDSIQQEQNQMPPAWFVNLVKTDYAVLEHEVLTRDNQTLTWVMQANPLDEITEVWHESVAFFLTICALVLFTFIAIHLVFNKTLKAIDIIVANLQLVEKGDYRSKLPKFSILEYDNIARAINHMSGVLDETQQHNRALTQHSLQIQEEERQHLSQELHDEFGQSLTAIKVMAVTATHDDADTKQITRSIIDICDHLMQVVRSMMQQLHPLILTELGLQATLEDLVDNWQKRVPNLSIDLLCDDKVDFMPQTFTIHILRVIQESLTNILRHSKADQVKIILQLNHEAASSLQLKIKDNGQGCDLNTMKSGFGLPGMKERITMLGGEFTYSSEPGRGMQIIANIPV